MADHFAGGVEEAAGGVEVDEEGGGVVAIGLGEGSVETPGGDGLDGIADFEFIDAGRIERAGICREGEDADRNQEEKSPEREPEMARRVCDWGKKQVLHFVQDDNFRGTGSLKSVQDDKFCGA